MYCSDSAQRVCALVNYAMCQAPVRCWARNCAIRECGCEAHLRAMFLSITGSRNQWPGAYSAGVECSSPWLLANCKQQWQLSDAVDKGSYGLSVALAVERYRVPNRVYVPVSLETKQKMRQIVIQSFICRIFWTCFLFAKLLVWYAFIILDWTDKSKPAF